MIVVAMNKGLVTMKQLKWMTWVFVLALLMGSVIAQESPVQPTLSDALAISEDVDAEAVAEEEMSAEEVAEIEAAKRYQRVKACLERHEIKFKERSDGFLIDVTLEECRVQDATLFILPCEDEVRILISSAGIARPDVQPQMAEFINRLNSRLLAGCFKMDYEIGAIHFICDAPYMEDDDDFARMMGCHIVLATEMLSMRNDAIIGVLLGLLTPEAAERAIYGNVAPMPQPPVPASKPNEVEAVETTPEVAP